MKFWLKPLFVLLNQLIKLSHPIVSAIPSRFSAWHDMKLASHRMAMNRSVRLPKICVVLNRPFFGNGSSLMNHPILVLRSLLGVTSARNSTSMPSRASMMEFSWRTNSGRRYEGVISPELDGRESSIGGCCLPSGSCGCFWTCSH